MSHRINRAQIIICLLAALALLPFAAKPVHVDDTMFLWTARQILHHPLDFYGFAVNWEGTLQPMADVMKNPPLVSYYQALAAAIGGFREIWLHIAFIPWALIALLATYSIAKRFTTHAASAALLLLASPALFVSATTLMADVMMLALWTSGVALWIEAIERDKPLRLLPAAAMIALAALTKYPALCAIPLMLAYALLHRRSLAAQLLCLAIPVAIVIAYELLSRKLYGRGLIADAGRFAIDYRPDKSHGLFTNLIDGAIFAGGSALAPALVLACAGSRTVLILRAAMCVVVIACFAGLHSFAGHPIDGARAVQLGVLAVLGVIMLGQPWTDFRNTRDVTALWLGLWIAGVFVFGAFVNWTTNARSFLPLVPPAAILAARMIERFPARRRAFQLAFTLAAAVSLAVALADYHLARADRIAADIVRQRCAGIDGKVWFTGHWGFQWYMESFAQPVDVRTTYMRPGDVLVLNLKRSSPSSIPAAAVMQIDDIEVPALSWVSTFSSQVGAGFYASKLGPLPFAFGKAPPERFLVYRIIAPIGPATRRTEEN